MNDPLWTDIVVAIAAIVQTLAVLGALVYAAQQVKAARLAREDQARDVEAAQEMTLRPYVSIHLDGESHIAIVGLVIQNTGQTPAFDVTFEIDPPLADTIQHPDEVVPLNEGVSSLAPRQVITCEFEYVIDRPESWPRRWDVIVRYRSGAGKWYSEPQTLDFSHYWGAVKVRDKNLDDIDKRLKDLTQAIVRLPDRLRPPEPRP